ncbi:MAG TPA: hypothetical protein VI757_11975 [Bacteroidia bacterium]|nr:hypothetical protein [Bacteroidia bacterium]
MTKLEVAKRGLENQLVFFSYEGRELRGIISNSIPVKEKTLDSQWLFIPSHIRKAWASANAGERKLLTDTEMIDIDRIMWCVAIL